MRTTQAVNRSTLAKRALFCSLVFATSLGCRPTHSINPAYAVSPLVTDAKPGSAAWAHDRLAAKLTIPPLRAVSLPAGSRELRLSTGAGMILGGEYGILRIVKTDQASRGEVWLYRDMQDDGKISLTVRREALVPSPNWKDVLARYDSIAARGLKIPEDGWGYSDAGELYIESLVGGEYSSIAVNAPRLRKGDAARNAASLASLVDSLVRVAQDQR